MPLNVKQRKFIKNIGKGLNSRESAIIAGYSNNSASVTANRLLKNDNIIKALERVGLSDHAIANGIKTNIESGMGVKATADTSLRGLELAARLRGYLDKEQGDTTTNNTLIIGELRTMPDDQLQARLQSLQRLTAIDNSKE